VTALRRDAAAGDSRRRGRRPAAAVVLALVLGCGSGPPPRLTLGQPIVDAADASGRHVARLELRNDGGRALALHGVRLDCGCRLQAPLPELLAPGEHATLAVRCRADADAALRPRAITVLSSDPERPEAVAAMTLPGGGAPAVGVYFGYVALGASAVHDLALRAGASDAPPTSSDAALSVEPRPPRADGARVVRLRFAPRQAGPFHGTLALGGAGGALEVSGVGYRDLIALPAEVHVPSETTRGAPPAIALKATGAAPVAITAVEAPEGLTADVQPTGIGREFRVLLRARAGRRPTSGAIVVRTTDPDEPVITIPVHNGDA